MVYWKFYQYSTPETLEKLYVSTVRSHLEYATPVWDPAHCKTQIASLEKNPEVCLENVLQIEN